MYIVLLVLLVLLVIGGVPTGPWWGTPHAFGWGPSGVGAVLVIVLVILLLTGRL